MPKKEIVLVYNDHCPREQVTFVKFTVMGLRRGLFNVTDLSDAVALGTSITDEVVKILAPAHRVVLFYDERMRRDVQAQSAAVVGILNVIRQQARANLMVVCEPSVRRTMPEWLNIGAQLSPMKYNDPESKANLEEQLRSCIDTHYDLGGEKMGLYNVGYSMAVGLVCGYFDHVYKDVQSKMKELPLYDENVFSLKAYILFPKHYTMPDDPFACDRIHLPRLDLDDRICKDGGLQDRIYRSSVYRILDRDGKAYYGHVEFATPLSVLKVLIEERFERHPPLARDLEERLRQDATLLENEMQNFIRMLRELDKTDQRVTIVEYDEKAPGWSTDQLADLLVEKIQEDLRGDVASIDTGAGGDRSGDEILVLPMSERTAETMSEVVALLETMEDRGRTVHWPEPDIGASHLQYFAEKLRRSDFYVLLYDRDVDNSPPLLKTLVQEIHCDVAVCAPGTKSLVIVTDCPIDAEDDIGNATLLSPYFVKWIRNWRTIDLEKALNDALSQNIYAIQYLNIGYCLASQFYHSYLMYKLPDLLTIYDDWTFDGVAIPRKLFIILQTSAALRYPKDLEPLGITVVDPAEKPQKMITKWRGGAKRDYPSKLCRITVPDEDTGKEMHYYVLFEYMACVATIEKIQKKFDLPDSWLKHEVNLYKEALCNELRRRPEWFNRVKVVEYDDSPGEEPLNMLLYYALDDDVRASAHSSDVSVCASSAPSKLSGASGSIHSSAPSEGTLWSGGDDSSGPDDLSDAENDALSASRNGMGMTVSRTVSGSKTSSQNGTSSAGGQGTSTSGGQSSGAASQVDGRQSVEEPQAEAAAMDIVLTEELEQLELTNDEVSESEYLDDIPNLPRSSSRLSLSERSRTSTLNRSEYSEDEFYDASEGNRTLGSLGDESYYQSVGDVSTQYFSDDEPSQHSDISTLSPDDSPNSSKDTAPLDKTADTETACQGSFMDSERNQTNDINFNQILSDDSNFSALEELPSIQVSTEEPSMADPRSREWQPSTGLQCLAPQPPRTLAGAVGAAAKDLARELGEEAVQIVGNELVTYIMDGTML